MPLLSKTPWQLYLIEKVWQLGNFWANEIKEIFVAIFSMGFFSVILFIIIKLWHFFSCCETVPRKNNLNMIHHWWIHNTRKFWMLSRLDLSELIQSIPQNFLPSKSYSIHIHSSKISEFVLEGKVPNETLQKICHIFYIGYYQFTKIQSCSFHFAF